MKPPASQFRSKLETLFAMQLKGAGIRYVEEYLFAEGVGRKFRADFAAHRGPPAGLGPDGSFYSEELGQILYAPTSHCMEIGPECGVLIECHGGAFVGGRHVSGTGFEADCEKASYAAALGWRVLPLSAKMVRDGSGLALVEAALGLKPVPVRPSKPPKKRSKIPKRASASKPPERFWAAARGAKR